MNFQGTIKEFMNEMWNTKNKDIEGLHSIFSDNAIINSPLGKNLGRNFIKNVNLKWDEAFPNMNLSSMEFISHGNKVATSWTSKGRNEGIFNSAMPSNRLVEYKGTTIFYFEKEKIVNYSCIINILDIYQQLGFYLEKEKYDKQSQIMNSAHLLVDNARNMEEGASKPTRQEVICLSLWVAGRTAKEIAQILSISFRTVQTHITNIMDKFQCNTKIQLNERVKEMGIMHILLDLQSLYIKNFRT